MCPTSSPSASPARLRIRLYRHGLGDCILLRFARSGGDTFNLLIDCGVISVGQAGRDATTSVAQDIADACGGRLDVVVLTHEHWDHVSGFSALQAQAIFGAMTIGEVWYGWTEDPQCELGVRLKKERAAKVSALAHACQALRDSPLAGTTERSEALVKLMGFFGFEAAALQAAVGRTREAFDFLAAKPGVKKRYCYPERAPLSLPGVPGLRVFVLGPPMSELLIKKSAPSRKASEVYDASADVALGASLEAAFLRMGKQEGGQDDDAPFPPALRQPKPAYGGKDPLSELVSALWDKEEYKWRQIEDDWTQAAEDMALNLDTHTNNTSVVLAFEFTDTGEVFLFPADAQVGSWLSWRDLRWQVKEAGGTTEVTGADLLRRTVFYKVGHHGSHNATLRASGLELMESEALVAFIPVIKEEAEKKRWFNMPFDPLVKRLQEKTGNRLLRSDDPPPQAAQDMGNLETTELYFELSFG